MNNLLAITKKIYPVFFLLFCFAQNNIIKIKTIEENEISYISLLDFAQKQNLLYTYYESKEKFEINYKNHKLLFSPLSSSLKINNKVYNLVYPTLYKRGIIYAPIITLSKIFEKEKIPTQILSQEKPNYVQALTNIYNITDVAVSNKKNGISVLFKTTKYFPEQNIAASINSEGWLNITILNGRADSLAIKKHPLLYPLIKSHIIQLPQSSQISFLCKKNIDDVVIQSSNQSFEILLLTQQSKNAQEIATLREKWSIDTIVLDPGHGGKDPGAIGINKLQEKTVALDIAKNVGKMLERNNLKVVYTRKNDTFVPLWKRTQIANNASGDLFISIHANSTSRSSKISGFETFLLRVGKTDDAIEVAKRENSVIEFEEKTNNYKKLTDEKLIMATMSQNADMKASEDLASFIQLELDKVISTHNRGVKQAGFHVLVGASMPNVLIEVGFLSNKQEANLLGKSQYRRNISKAIFNAIIKFKEQYAE